jgi:hypothetical protein
MKKEMKKQIFFYMYFSHNDNILLILYLKYILINDIMIIEIKKQKI